MRQRVLVVVALAALVATAAYAAGGGDPLWVDQHDGNGTEDSAVAVAAAKKWAFVAGLTSESGTFDAFIRAYNIASGKLLWEDRFDPGAGTSSSFNALATDGKRVYAAGSSRPELMVRAYSARKGKPLWVKTHRVEGAVLVSRGIVTDGGRVFLIANSLPDADLTDRDWYVFAHDGRTGALLWKDRLDVRPGVSSVWAVAAASGRLFAGGDAQAADDSYWRLRAYDAGDGSLLWEDRQRGGSVLDVVAKGGDVYATGSDRDGGILRAYDAATGARRWTVSPGVSPFDFLRELTLAGNRLYIAGTPGNVIEGALWVTAYDTRTGAMVWNDVDPTRPGVPRDIVAYRKVAIVVGWFDNKAPAAYGEDYEFFVRAYRLQNGQRLWEEIFDLAGDRDIAHGVAAVKGRAVVAGTCTNAAGNGDFLVRTYRAR